MIWCVQSYVYIVRHIKFVSCCCGRFAGRTDLYASSGRWKVLVVVGF